MLETRLDLGGYPVNICDTAGLRHETNDPIEKEGIDRALTAANQADLVRNDLTDLGAVLAVVVCAGWCFLFHIHFNPNPSMSISFTVYYNHLALFTSQYNTKGCGTITDVI